jgi:ubiquinone/menaquinone biosynthesis C-methylase UbiE
VTHSSFIKSRKNILSNKLYNLIKLFKKLEEHKKENLTSFTPYLFLRFFSKVHFFLKKKKLDLKLYYSAIDNLSKEIIDILETSKNFGFKKFLKNTNLSIKNKKDLKTEDYYGILFENFSDKHYYKEPYDLLKTRLKRNNVNLQLFKNKRILDYGCGNGRYTQAIAKLSLKKLSRHNNSGESQILGYDKSKTNILTARIKNRFSNVEYKVGDVNQNNLPKESFDIVFCNGVLHHTGDISLGLRQIYKILKSDGICIIYLSSTDGIKWYCIEAFRKILKNYNKIYFFKSLVNLNLNYNKIFYLMDHVFVKYNDLTTKKEVENLFKSSNFKIIKRFNRGHSIDDTERLFQLKKMNPKKAFSVYGYGEHRYILKKNI